MLNVQFMKIENSSLYIRGVEPYKLCLYLKISVTPEKQFAILTP